MQGTERFAEETASVLRKKLGNGYKVRQLTVEKINKGKLYALLITDGENMVSPAFYLESFYSRHISYGYTADETAESIIKKYNSIEGLIKGDRNLALNLSRKEWVKDRLFLVLINKDKNKDFLSDAVYSGYAGLALVMDVDRIVTGRENGITGLECKTASPYSAEKWKDGKIPAHYIIQCHHYMSVLGAEAWYIAVMVYGREFKYMKIERDEEIIQQLIRFLFDRKKNNHKLYNRIYKLYLYLKRNY